MRTIKFRIFNQKTKSWSVEPFTFQPGSPLGQPGKLLQQFTEVYDRNGKEIYEGDFVKVGGECVCYCLHSKQAGAFVLWGGGEDISLSQPHTFEVVGNLVDSIQHL